MINFSNHRSIGVKIVLNNHNAETRKTYVFDVNLLFAISEAVEGVGLSLQVGQTALAVSSQLKGLLLVP